jgi:hypothetical protein
MIYLITKLNYGHDEILGYVESEEEANAIQESFNYELQKKTEIQRCDIYGKYKSMHNYEDSEYSVEEIEIYKAPYKQKDEIDAYYNEALQECKATELQATLERNKAKVDTLKDSVHDFIKNYAVYLKTWSLQNYTSMCNDVITYAKLTNDAAANTFIQINRLMVK